MRQIGFLGIIGVLCLGCVEPPARPSESVLGALKAEVAALPNHYPWRSPGQRRPDHQLQHIHVLGAIKCSGVLSRELSVYAEGWVTAPGFTGEIIRGRQLDVEIHVNSGLFQGLVRKDGASGAKVESESLLLKGNYFSDPCSCVAVVANAKAPDGTKIRARKEICPGVSEPAKGRAG